MTPDLNTFFEAGSATWPAAETRQTGAVTLRRGLGGGRRVSAASADTGWTGADLNSAEAMMRDMDQTPLFSLPDTGCAQQSALDDELSRRGYVLADKTRLMTCPIDRLTGIKVPLVTAFVIWPVLEIMKDIWDETGIGPERRAVMNRVTGPKRGIFGRTNDKPAGAGFCAVHGEIAFVHSLEILPAHQRNGLGRWMMAIAGQWAAQKGARHMAVFCTEANTQGLAFYRSLGLQDQGGYHYRVKEISA